jgi:hypothetical protein
MTGWLGMDEDDSDVLVILCGAVWPVGGKLLALASGLGAA